MTYEEQRRKRRMSFYSLERRELIILEAKAHALKTIGTECTEKLEGFLKAEHDDAKALDAFKDHVSLFKDAYRDYLDQKGKVDEFIAAQQEAER